MGQGREAVRKVPESNATEEGVDPTVTTKKRKGESHCTTDHGGKKHKADSMEASVVVAEKACKDAESMASEEDKAAAAKEKADAEATAKEKADAEAAAKEKATGMRRRRQRQRRMPRPLLLREPQGRTPRIWC
jgi:hypothetical protein